MTEKMKSTPAIRRAEKIKHILYHAEQLYWHIPHDVPTDNIRKAFGNVLKDIVDLAVNEATGEQ